MTMTTAEVMERVRSLDTDDSAGWRQLVWDAHTPVYQPESWRWCRRHNGPIAVGIGAPRMRCMGWFWEEISGGAEDQGRCQVVPLYIEAEDP